MSSSSLIFRGEVSRIFVLEGFLWRKREAEQIDVSREQKSLNLLKGYTVSQYDLNGNVIKVYSTIAEASKATGDC